jgi:uncharacterized 2Fe-2S/4Fe-4S cluster protein (DUF4445 family)
MAHLFLGLDPASLGRVPFTPVIRRHPTYPAAELGLAAHPQAVVDVLPSISAYVGGDLVADLHVAHLMAAAVPTLLIDIGTNGEMLYAADGRISACATAAGPAFEGAGLACGGRAARGAIEHVDIAGDGQVRLGVIGGGHATSICGSGIIDFVAAARQQGFVNAVGRYDLDRVRAAGRYLDAPTCRGPSHAFVLAAGRAGGESVYVSEADLAQVLKAKAAIQAGLVTLLETRGARPEDLGRIVLAGGFARHIHLGRAKAMGLLPDLPDDRFENIGNGALAGAYHALIDAAALPAMEAAAGGPDVVELNLVPSFESHFIDALSLPEPPS